MALQQLDELPEAAEQLRKCLEMQNPPQQASEALSGILLKLKSFDEAVCLCYNRIAVAPSPVLFFNLNTALRQINRMAEAIQITCDALAISPNCAASTATVPHVPLAASHYTVVCVKYGTKYDAQYVNILHDSLRRNSAVAWDFVCFTDDPNGLDESIDVRVLPSLEWQGWWFKAYLFSQNAGLNGRVVYFDLDTVVIANIDAAFAFEGRFGVLGCRSMRNENHRQGINTSAMVWTAGDLQGIFDLLALRYKDVMTVLHKFDHWVECVAFSATTALNDASLVPTLEGMFIEYAEYCTSYDIDENRNGDVQSHPLDAAVVCFPLTPKPHQLVERVRWVGENWRRDLVREQEETT